MRVDLEFDYNEKTSAMEHFSQKDIDDLKEWSIHLDPSKCVPKDLTDKDLVLFYNACVFDVDKTKTCIEKYYSYKKNAPEFFDNRNVTLDCIVPYVESLEFAFLPQQSPEGYDIIFHRLHITEPSRYSLDVGIKLLFMTVEACLNQRGPQKGYMFLFDMRGVKLGHILRLSLSSLRKFFQYVQEAESIRMRAIHVLNTEPVLDKLLLIIKPFMNKELYEMIKFHNKGIDMEEFYKTVLPRSALPSDYGGELPDTQALHKQCMQELQRLQPYFTAEERRRKAAIPEKKRKEKDVERSFQKLDID